MKKITKEWQKIQNTIDEYKEKKLSEIYERFCLNKTDKSLKENKICLITNPCIFKLKKICDQNFKIFHRLIEIEFDKNVGEWYLICDKNCGQDETIHLYEWEQYILYDNDKSEFNNKEIEKLKIIYEYEDSVSKRKEILKQMNDISNNCSHYFKDYVCQKCGIEYIVKYAKYKHRV